MALQQQQLTQTSVSSETQRLHYDLEAHKQELERVKQEQLDTMKIDCQNALARQLQQLEERLSQKEAAHIAEQDLMKIEFDAEKQKNKL